MPRRKKENDPAQKDLLDVAVQLRTAPCVPALREAVKKWRDDKYKGATETTRLLLNYWFKTDIQQFYERRTVTNVEEPEEITALLGPKPPAQKLEITDFGERIGRREGHLLVINDEAHHTHEEDNEWNQVSRRLHEKTPLTAQLDFSATPRFQKGAIFPWTIFDYPLKQAIVDNEGTHWLLETKGQ
jgi:type III restriction enzyme